jgi:regulator of protease activity HflC (stomatin/prohibitin superfamily)
MTRHRPNDTRYSFAALAAGLVGAAGLAGGMFLAGIAPLVAALAGVALGVLLAASIKYTDQWEKAVVLRLGRYRGLRGPGYFGIVPVFDRVAYTIDQRIRTAAFGAESCLTRDTVPVNVDAIAFWIVRDAERAALEVQDYDEAVILSAQTALRDAIGKHDLAELIQSRVELGQGLKVALEQKMVNWGIHVQSVEIRDVIIPANLQNAMSKQAQAERERQARIILSTAETEIAAKFVEAARPYQNNPVAVHLRAMNMLYEGLKEKGALMLIPSSAVESMGMGGMLGAAAMRQERLTGGSSGGDNGGNAV